MRYITIYDFLEKLIKQRFVNKTLLSFLEYKYIGIASSLIEMCINNNIIEEIDDKLVLKNSISLIMLLPLFGIMPDKLSAYIEWNEFEIYISQVFSEFGWDIYTNYVHTKIKRFQIDVIALNEILKLSLFIECKHWKHMARRNISIQFIVNKHLERIKKYLDTCEWVCVKITKLRNIKNIVPIVVTLYELPVKVLKGVALVPINKLIDFVANIDSYIDSLNLVVYKNRCHIET